MPRGKYKRTPFSERYKHQLKNSLNDGENSGYLTVHQWLRRTYGNADRCENLTCECKSSKYDYALLRGKGYERDRTHFIMLCKDCHSAYDRKGLAL